MSTKNTPYSTGGALSGLGSNSPGSFYAPLSFRKWNMSEARLTLLGNLMN
jgi:hypothetical protein